MSERLKEHHRTIIIEGGEDHKVALFYYPERGFFTAVWDSTSLTARDYLSAAQRLIDSIEQNPQLNTDPNSTPQELRVTYTDETECSYSGVDPEGWEDKPILFARLDSPFSVFTWEGDVVGLATHQNHPELYTQFIMDNAGFDFDQQHLQSKIAEFNRPA